MVEEKEFVVMGEQELREKELEREVQWLVEKVVMKDRAQADIIEAALMAGNSLKNMKFGLKSNGWTKKKQHVIESVSVPDAYCCPLSGKLMDDPVIIKSQETFDRPFIQAWLNEGYRTCPKTGQILSHLLLVPNNQIRDLIVQWCNENYVHRSIDGPMNDGVDCITQEERSHLRSLLETISLTDASPTGKMEALKELRRITGQSPSFRALFGQSMEALPRLLSVFSKSPLCWYPKVRSDVLSVIINISKLDYNKELIGDDPQAIPFIIACLQTGRMELRAKTAMAIVILARLHSNKIKFCELGAMKPLVEILETKDPRTVSYVAAAIIVLCDAEENLIKAVREGVVKIGMEMMKDILYREVGVELLWSLKGCRFALMEMASKIHILSTLKTALHRGPRRKKILVLLSLVRKFKLDELKGRAQRKWSAFVLKAKRLLLRRPMI